MTEKDWIKKVKSVHPKADGQVLQFIYDFRTMQKSEAAEEVINNCGCKPRCLRRG